MNPHLPKNPWERKMMVERPCEHCKETFEAFKGAVKRGGGRFCSRSCKGLNYWEKKRGNKRKIEIEYIQWLFKAQEMVKRGLKQSKCLCHKTWHWPDERKGHKFKEPSHAE